MTRTLFLFGLLGLLVLRTFAQDFPADRSQSGQYVFSGAFCAPVSRHTNTDIMPGFKGGMGQILFRKKDSRRNEDHSFSLSEQIVIAEADLGFFQGNHAHVFIKGGGSYIYLFNKWFFAEGGVSLGIERSFALFNQKEAQWHEGSMHVFPMGHIGIGAKGKIAQRTSLFRLKPGLALFVPQNGELGGLASVLEFEVTYLLKKDQF